MTDTLSRLSGCDVLGEKDSPVIPIMIYNPTKIAAFSRECLKRGVSGLECNCKGLKKTENKRFKRRQGEVGRILNALSGFECHSLYAKENDGWLSGFECDEGGQREANGITGTSVSFNHTSLTHTIFIPISREQVAAVVVGFPATPLLLSRARFCVSAGHTREDLDRMLVQVDEVLGLLCMRYRRSAIGY